MTHDDSDKGNMIQLLRSTMAIVALVSLSGCIFATVVGGTTATSSAIHDKRSVGEHLDDIVLAGKIRGRMAVEKDFPSRWVSVEVVEGSVVLTGYLPKRNQINRAIQISRNFPGVKHVRSEIKLGKPALSEVSSDTWITAQVKSKLLDDPVTSGFSIHVETVKGKVYLQGLVQSNIERHRARDVAFSIKGVVDVVDIMHIEKE